MNWAAKPITGVVLSVALMTPAMTGAVPLSAHKSASTKPTTAAAPSPPKSAAPAGAPNKSAANLVIIHNADGTFTIQKVPPNGTSKDSKGSSGLVIPSQVVTPLIADTEKKARHAQ